MTFRDPSKETLASLDALYIFDFETTSRGPDKSPDPDYEDNFALQLGWKATVYNNTSGWAAVVTRVHHNVHLADLPEQVDRLYACLAAEITGRRVALVGHNVSFDFRWLLRCVGSERAAVLKNKVALGDLILIDTADIVYVLSGHHHKMKPLKESAELFKLPVGKDDYLASLFAEGKTAEDADMDRLAEYLVRDVEVTYEVLKKGWEIATSSGRDGLLYRTFCSKSMTCLAEAEGLPFDPLAAYDDAEVLIRKLDEIGTVREAAVKRLCQYVDARIASDPLGLSETEVEEGIKAAVTSPKKLLLLLQAMHSTTVTGMWKHKSKQLIGTYKNGKPKYKTVEEPVTVRWLGSVLPFKPESADEATISKIVEVLADVSVSCGASEHMLDVLSCLLEERLLEKQISTYYLPLIQSASQSRDGRVHHRLNTNVTSTGRLSSSNPNAQNMPSPEKCKVRNHFTEEGWQYVEGDFKQVEVVGLCARSRCEALRNVLVGGGDMHFETGKTVFGWTHPSEMTKADKRIVKGVNFGLIYGGSPAGLAAQTGVPENLCKRIADSFYATFPGVKAFQDSIVKTANEKQVAWPSGGTCSDTGMPRTRYVYKCPITTRTYLFGSYAGNSWVKGKKTVVQKPSPTQLKNYTVQGFATADFVPYAMAYCVRELSNVWQYGVHFRFINTVHDSIQFQIRDDVDAGYFAGYLAGAMTRAWDSFLASCGQTLDPFLKSLPMKGEIDVGKSWGEMKTMT